MPPPFVLRLWAAAGIYVLDKVGEYDTAKEIFANIQSDYDVANDVISRYMEWENQAWLSYSRYRRSSASRIHDTGAGTTSDDRY